MALLRKGSSGDAVRQLQQALIAAGFPLPKFGADGHYGAETAAAVKAWKASRGYGDTNGNVIETNELGGAQAGAPGAPSLDTKAELGSMAGYLDIPELRPLLEQAAREKWQPDKVRAAVEGTEWWRTHTERQRSWIQLSPADRERAVAEWQVRLVEDLRNLWGPDQASARGFNLGAVRAEAEALASGTKIYESFIFDQRGAAEQVEGTAAFVRLLEQRRQAGEAGVSIENLQSDLETQWREWMGDHVATPGNLNQWARDIFENRQSAADFEAFVKQTAGSLYANKPEHVPFRTWIAQPKAFLAQAFELAEAGVRDDDPLLMSYARGEIPDLGQFALRLRRDARFQSTEREKARAREMGQALSGLMGFSVT